MRNYRSMRDVPPPLNDNAPLHDWDRRAVSLLELVTALQYLIKPPLSADAAHVINMAMSDHHALIDEHVNLIRHRSDMIAAVSDKILRIKENLNV